MFSGYLRKIVSIVFFSLFAYLSVRMCKVLFAFSQYSLPRITDKVINAVLIESTKGNKKYHLGKNEGSIHIGIRPFTTSIIPLLYIFYSAATVNAFPILLFHVSVYSILLCLREHYRIPEMLSKTDTKFARVLEFDSTSTFFLGS